MINHNEGMDEESAINGRVALDENKNKSENLSGEFFCSGKNDETKDDYYMKKAIELAEKAVEIDEVPIGCIIVCNDKIIGRGYNKRNSSGRAIAHAEIMAIEEANSYAGDWRLEGATTYVTLEPCPMCAGAILQSRLSRVVIGAMNKKAGSVGSVVNLLNNEKFNHQVDVTYGVCEDECSALLSNFFKKLRGK